MSLQRLRYLHDARLFHGHKLKTYTGHFLQAANQLQCAQRVAAQFEEPALWIDRLTPQNLVEQHCYPLLHIPWCTAASAGTGAGRE